MRLIQFITLFPIICLLSIGIVGADEPPGSVEDITSSSTQSGASAKPLFRIISVNINKKIILMAPVSGTIAHSQYSELPGREALEVVLKHFNLVKVEEGDVIRIYPKNDPRLKELPPK